MSMHNKRDHVVRLKGKIMHMHGICGTHMALDLLPKPKYVAWNIVLHNYKSFQILCQISNSQPLLV